MPPLTPDSSQGDIEGKLRPSGMGRDLWGFVKDMTESLLEQDAAHRGLGVGVWRHKNPAHPSRDIW